MDRRDFVQTVGAGVAGYGLLAGAQQVLGAENSNVKVGMCDWNLMSGSCDPEKIPLAAEAHLNGLQVSVGREPNSIPLRDPKVRQRYLELGKKHNVQCCSVAAGSILNNYALSTEPQSAIFVLDAIEAAKALGADNILIAFFGNGDLRLKDGRGEVTEDLRTGNEDGSFKLDEKKVLRVIEVMRQIVPRAEDHGIILGLENTITAYQNVEIIEAIGSPIVQVYYDVGNSTGHGYNCPKEIEFLGKERICQIHLKDWETRLLGSNEASVDSKSIAASCKKIGYDKWFVLETSGRDGSKQDVFVEDTRTNVAFAKQMYG